MIRETLTLSALIAAVLLVRAVFKDRVPKRMIYALWLVVLLFIFHFCWSQFSPIGIINSSM